MAAKQSTPGSIDCSFDSGLSRAFRVPNWLSFESQEVPYTVYVLAASILCRLSEVQDMRYAPIALLLATAACAMAVATPAPGQAASTAASAHSNSVAAGPKMPHPRLRLDTAQAQIHPQRPPDYGSMQAPIGHRRPTQDDLEKIDKDNQQLDLPASQDDITGAGQDALTKKIGQDNPTVDNEIKDICTGCGGAEYAPVHHRPSPIHNGFNHQPTEDELRALHQEDVTRDEAQETDRLYDQLMSGNNQILRQHPAPAP
jgi:hypothetical protein